ncbi:MAG: peptidoglycan-binding domain-containing protein [Longimicrobiales bacterium]
MQKLEAKWIRSIMAPLIMTGLGATALSAQTRVTLPSGSVILVRTEQPLESGTAKVGQTFSTTVTEPVSVNGYTLIPANSSIRGVMTFVQPATRQQSGVIQVTFDRLTLPSGSVFTIAGKLTSTDSTERRQIDARADSRVVFIGERGGIGAAIAGAGSKGSAGGILAALGSMLSEGTNVSVPANTKLAVQLERSVTLTGQGAVNTADESTIYTAGTRIRAAQAALARKSYYRGTATGVLDNATRRALFEFQLDNDITATGNLDGRTANALGILGTADGSGGAALSAADANIVRRAAQALVTRERVDLGISAAGVLNPNRTYAEGDLEVLFALSAFADNASLYDQFVRASTDTDNAVMAGGGLIAAARRVDAAMQQVRSSAQVQNSWQAIRRQLVQLDETYGR